MSRLQRLGSSLVVLAALCSDSGVHCVQVQSVQAYVISGVQERWLSTSKVLATLGIQPQRVVPIKPTQKLAEREFIVHNYDANTDVGSVRQEREFSLLATFKKVFRMIARQQALADDQFALLFEDDIAVHTLFGAQDFFAALAYGAHLAQADGLLYLGSCGPTCDDGSAHQHHGFAFVKCASRCTHAFAVTKRRARSLIADLHANMVGHQIASDHGHCIDQLLYHFSMHNNLSWVVGSNFVSPQNGAHVGLFYQDRARFSSTLDA